MWKTENCKPDQGFSFFFSIERHLVEGKRKKKKGLHNYPKLGAAISERGTQLFLPILFEYLQTLCRHFYLFNLLS